MSRRRASERILDALRHAYPSGVHSTELQREFGPAAKSRIGDLRREGWRIETIDGEDGATYRLQSLTRGEVETVPAGVVIRHSTREGWTARTHREAEAAGVVPAEVLERAQRAALDAYRAIVDEYLLGVRVAPSPVTFDEPEEEEDDDLAFGGDWRSYV